MTLAVSRYFADVLAERLRRELDRRPGPIFVALDGRSGTGKSTIAAMVVDRLDAGREGGSVGTVIEGDQFYGGGSPAVWDGRSAAENADCVIDWRRQLAVLRSLRTRGFGAWRAFDWESDDWDADLAPLRDEPTRCIVTPVVILEGVYSARPELAELIDMRVLVRIPTAMRLAQLEAREGAVQLADWDARWREAENHYFESMAPAEGFDLILEGAPNET